MIAISFLLSRREWGILCYRYTFAGPLHVGLSYALLLANAMIILIPRLESCQLCWLPNSSRSRSCGGIVSAHSTTLDCLGSILPVVIAYSGMVVPVVLTRQYFSRLAKNGSCEQPMSCRSYMAIRGLLAQDWWPEYCCVPMNGKTLCCCEPNHRESQS